MLSLFHQMYALRRLMQGSQLSPKAPLGNNARPVQPLHHRTVRTNINFNKLGLPVSEININYSKDYIIIILFIDNDSVEKLYSYDPPIKN